MIALYDAKYAYHVWRPVTAIRNADADSNPDTTADPTWTPLSPTAPDPSYPGAHGTVSAAAAEVLVVDLRQRLRLHPRLPGSVRRRTVVRQLSEAAEEASASRIYNGNHTRVDQVAGENLGHDVAAFALLGNAPGARSSLTAPRDRDGGGGRHGRRPREPP